MFHRFSAMPAKARSQTQPRSAHASNKNNRNRLADLNPSPDHVVLPLAKRQKATRACDRCRLHRIKCDEQKPCTQCISIKAKCILSYEPAHFSQSNNSDTSHAISSSSSVFLFKIRCCPHLLTLPVMTTALAPAAHLSSPLTVARYRRACGQQGPRWTMSIMNFSASTPTSRTPLPMDSRPSHIPRLTQTTSSPNSRILPSLQRNALFHRRQRSRMNGVAVCGSSGMCTTSFYRS